MKRVPCKVINKKCVSIALFLILMNTNLSFSSFQVVGSPNTDYVSPSNRYGHGMIFDTSNARFILFGGVVKSEGMTTWHSNETWSYLSETKSWSRIPTSSNPGLIAHHSMAYDSDQQKIVCFGGLSESGDVLNETWIFDCITNDWYEVFSPTYPQGRSDAGLYYDGSNQKFILFGGFGGESLYYLGDLWIYDIVTNSWTERHPSMGPSPSYGLDMVYDSDTDQGILFGGRTLSGVQNDIWIYHYTNDSWIKRDQSLKPITRYWHTMLFDSSNNQVVVFGGRQSQYFTSPVLNDTWSYHPSQDTWIKYDTSIVPPSSSSRIAYDSIHQKALLFGGVSSISPFIYSNGTWEFDCQTNSWSNITKPLNLTSTSTISLSGTTESTDLGISVLFLTIFPVYQICKRRREEK